MGIQGIRTRNHKVNITLAIVVSGGGPRKDSWNTLDSAVRFLRTLPRAGSLPQRFRFQHGFLRHTERCSDATVEVRELIWAFAACRKVCDGFDLRRLAFHVNRTLGHFDAEQAVFEHLGRV